jgi:hypothetical protein
LLTLAGALFPLTRSLSLPGWAGAGALPPPPPPPSLPSSPSPGMFKRVTLKDPLSRIYAQRLRSVPAPVNEGVIARPRRREEVAHLAEGKSSAGKGKAAKAEQQAVDQYVDDVITSMGNAQPPEPGLRAAPPKPSGQASAAKPRKRRAAGAEVGTGAGAAAGAEMPAMGGSGRVVLNHSTHIPGLIDVLHRLVETEGIFTIVPGPLSRCAICIQRGGGREGGGGGERERSRDIGGGGKEGILVIVPGRLYRCA